MIVIMDIYECDSCNSHYAIENGMKEPACPNCMKYTEDDEKVKQIEIEVGEDEEQ